MEQLSLTRGDDRAVAFDLRAPSVAGWPATLTIRERVDAPTTVLVSHSTVEPDGTVVFHLPNHATDVLPLGRLVGDVQVTSPDGIISTMTPEGNQLFDPVFVVVVFGDITRPGDSVGSADDDW